MSDKHVIFLIDKQRKQYAKDCIDQAPEDFVCTIRKKTRTIDQNAKLWAMLNDVSQQVKWYGRKLSSEDWKHVFTASLKQMDTVPGIDGGVVMLGQSTSNMTISEMRDLIELMFAFGAERDVKWSERFINE